MSPIKRPRFGGVFLFCPFEIQPRTSVCSAFCVVHAKFTTSDAKSFTGLCRSFSGYLPHFAPVIRLRILLCCTSCKALEDIQASAAPPPIPDTTATPDAAQDRAAAYYNNIYRGVCRCVPVMDPCQAVQHIADHASSAGSAPIMCGVLTHCQHYRPGAPTEGVSVSTCTWSARRRLDTSHARRFAVWHWVNGQSAQGQLGTLHPAGSPAAGTRRAAWNH